jgi:hypothetical protein
MAVHVARIGMVHVTPTGAVKTHANMTIGEAARSSSEIRVLPNPSIPNSVGYPTIEDYLTAEDTAGFSLRHLDQTFIITTQT